jgi:hypothetical protein
MVMSGYPQVTEMLYTWTISLADRQAAVTLGWFFALLTFIGLVGYLRQLLGINPSWVGLAALLAGPTLVISASLGYVDWFGLFFGLGCLILLDQWCQNNNQLDLIFAGAFAGLALGSKYTAGILGLVAISVLVWNSKVKRIKFLPV